MLPKRKSSRRPARLPGLLQPRLCSRSTSTCLKSPKTTKPSRNCVKKASVLFFRCQGSQQKPAQVLAWLVVPTTAWSTTPWLVVFVSSAMLLASYLEEGPELTFLTPFSSEQPCSPPKIRLAARRRPGASESAPGAPPRLSGRLRLICQKPRPAAGPCPAPCCNPAIPLDPVLERGLLHGHWRC